MFSLMQVNYEQEQKPIDNLFWAQFKQKANEYCHKNYSSVSVCFGHRIVEINLAFCLRRKLIEIVLFFKDFNFFLQVFNDFVE